MESTNKQANLIDVVKFQVFEEDKKKTRNRLHNNFLREKRDSLSKHLFQSVVMPYFYKLISRHALFL